MGENQHQIAIRNNSYEISVPEGDQDTLYFWLKNYLEHAVTTAESSRKVQVRDLLLFIRFAEKEGAPMRPMWTPRLSRAFIDFLRTTLRSGGQRYWADRTINRILAHVKTFAKWIHKLAPFPLGNPMGNIRLIGVGENLDIERAFSDGERRRLLDAADLLPSVWGKSRDRRRNKNTEPVARPRRKYARPWRNRAMMYTLIETGMRRGALVNINVSDIDWDRHLIITVEKGGYSHSYSISDQGLKAIQDYLTNEREVNKGAGLTALFLPASTIRNSSGRLTPLVVNQVWNEVCTLAQVSGKTPHSARHAMGKHIIEKTGNIAAVQRQLGHRNVAYSVQYARVSNKELRDVLNNRS